MARVTLYDDPVSVRTRTLRHVVRAEMLVGATVAFVLGLITLGRKSWSFDEAFDVSLATDTWWKYVLKAGYYEPSQAVYLIFFKLWRSVTPESEWFTRFPSVVAAAATAALVGYLSARLFNRFTGLVAGALIATNASVVAWSQQTRTYTLATLAATVVTILFLEAKDAEPNDRRRWLVYGCAGGIGIYAHFFVAFVLATHLILIPQLSSEQRRRLREAWIVIGIAGLPALAVNIFGENYGADYLKTTSWSQTIDAVKELSGFNVFALVLAAAGVVAIFARRAPASESWKGTLLLVWALAPLAGALLVSTFKPLVAGRYLLVSAPALAILGAVALTTIRPRWVAAAAAVLVLAISAREIVIWYRSDPMNWRTAARFGATMERDGFEIALFPSGNYIPYQLYAHLPTSCRHLRGHHEPRCNFRLKGKRAVVITTRPGTQWRQLPGASGYVVTREDQFGEHIRALRLQRRGDR